MSKVQAHRDNKAAAKQRSSEPTVRSRAARTKDVHPAAIVQRAMISPRSLTSRDVLQLQRTIGNQAVQRLLGHPGPTDVKSHSRTKPSETAGQAEVPSIVNEVVRSPGQPLEPASRDFMESRFQHDFSAVRVHTGSEAAEAARAIQARAFTVGPDIVFGHGEFAPGTSEGKRLMAHELSHVIQQRSNPMFAGRVVQRQPSALEQSTSQAERGNLRVLTLEHVKKLSPEDVEKEFKEKPGKIPVDEVKFGPGIADGIKDGLKNLAAEFFSAESFTFNTVTNVPLNLKKVGGVNGVYRFTLIERRTAPRRQLIIEQVADTPPADPSKIDVDKATKSFEKFEFTLSTGFGGDAQKKLLFAALARVPDSILNRIKGVKFELSPAATGDRDEAGHYDPNTHTITLFQDSLKKFMNSTDASGSDFFTHALTHEVGHALDFESFTQARVKRDTLVRQLQEARTEAKRTVKDITDANAQAAKERRDKEEITRLENALTQARSDFDRVLAAQNVQRGGGYSQSREFATASGRQAISVHATKGGNVENFAELFSLFILDPDLLKSLRPDAHKYFSDRFR